MNSCFMKHSLDKYLKGIGISEYKDEGNLIIINNNNNE